MNKYTTVELIEYLTNIGFMTDFDTEEDTKKIAEIQGRLLELEKIKAKESIDDLKRKFDLSES